MVNSPSMICQFMDNHWQSWHTDLTNKGINIKFDKTYPLAIFNYGDGVDFSDPVVQEARGIIIEIERDDGPRVVCWPFRKFGNYQEPYADKIDWNTAYATEKIDGSIMKLWWHPFFQRWWWSSNGMIDANECEINNSGMTMFDMVRRADNYGDVISAMNSGRLDINCTYMFELVTPFNQIVIRYPTTHLYHIGTRNNSSGQEFGFTLDHVDSPLIWPGLRTLDDCINFVNNWNTDQHNVEHEGFVVVDANYHRVKIKSPEYLLMHHVCENGRFSAKRIVKGLRHCPDDINYMCNAYPHIAHIFKYYQWQIAEFEYQVCAICDLVDRLSAEFNGDRKAIAMAIKDNRYKAIGFEHLNGKRSDEILAEMSDTYYMKYIDEYKGDKT